MLDRLHLVSLLVDTPALHVLPAGRVADARDELRAGHLLDISLGEGGPVVSRLRVVVEATEADGAFRAGITLAGHGC